MSEPLLKVENLTKQYARGLFRKEVTFSLAADFVVDKPSVVGVMGPNGSGKTTLFELITGSNLPTGGRVLVAGRNIHNVRTRERDRLAIHYHQSYQVRHFQRSKPDMLLEPAGSAYPLVHLFDEPQFNTQDGYIGFMLDFFRKLKSEGKLVFLCLHPQETVHLQILEEVCERYLFVHKDATRTSRILQADTLDELARDARVRNYLGKLAPEVLAA